MTISIVTINFNNLNGLQATMASVMEQSHPGLQYIVIDGGSTDGSAAYIASHEERLDYWVSEPDQGTYFAMNKGIDRVEGAYVLFLNSGDVLHSPEVIASFVASNPQEDLVYGDTMLVHTDGANTFKSMPDQLLGFELFERTLNHQSTFFKASLFSEQQYDTSYKILADWAFYNKQLLCHKATYRHIPLVIAQYGLDGLSSDPANKETMRQERLRFYKEHIEWMEPYLVQDFCNLRSRYDQLQANRWVRLGKWLNSIKKRFT